MNQGPHAKSQSPGPLIVDASAWEGVCVSYLVRGADMVLEMDLGEAGNAAVGNDLPSVVLPMSESGAVKAFTWSEFKQLKGTNSITGEEAAE